jgi:hypothetical protein
VGLQELERVLSQRISWTRIALGRNTSLSVYLPLQGSLVLVKWMESIITSRPKKNSKLILLKEIS